MKFTKFTKTDPKTFVPDLESGINFYHPDDRAFVKEYVEKAFTKKESFSFEFRLITAKNNLKNVVAKSVLNIAPSGEVVSVFGIFQDITEEMKRREERENLIKKLAESNSDLEKFAHVCAHDLKEPIRTISSFTELIKEELQDAPKK